VIEVARYLGVAPWELAEQPLQWLQWGMAAMVATRAAEAAQYDK
jgi:hypothetical protein